MPSLLDRYLGHTGYDSQQYDGPEDPNRANNLWGPVPGDHGAHGSFDERASDHSVQLWMDTHRWWLALAAALGGASALYGVRKNRERGEGTAFRWAA